MFKFINFYKFMKKIIRFVSSKRSKGIKRIKFEKFCQIVMKIRILLERKIRKYKVFKYGNSVCRYFKKVSLVLL